MYKTEYIAPLRLKLDPSQHEDSTVSISQNSQKLTVEWTNLTLVDQPESGKFTFQTTLHESGLIVFAYKKVHDLDLRPTKHLYDGQILSGISDGFIKNGYFYQYHAVNVPVEKINDLTVVLFQPLSTCKTQTNCHDCLLFTSFACTWCPHEKR